MISFEISISRKIKEFRDEKERFGHFGNEYLGTVRLRDVQMEICVNLYPHISLMNKLIFIYCE